MYDHTLKQPIPNRRERRARWRATGGGTERWRDRFRVAGSHKPFKALAAYMPRLQTAYALPASEQPAALAALGLVRSRGHGGRINPWQRSVMGRAMQNRSRY
jgi:hypothetical protein